MGGTQQLLSRPVATEGKVTNNGLINLDSVQIYIRPTNSLDIGFGQSWFGIESINNYPPSNSSQYKNYYYKDATRANQSPSKFYVEVFVTSEEDITLHLKEVVLSSNELGTIRPTSYIGPLKKYGTRRYGLALCHPDQKPENSIESPIVLLKNQSLCFALAYDTQPPSPSEKFTIDFNALNIDGNFINIGPIEFRESKELLFLP